MAGYRGMFYVELREKRYGMSKKNGKGLEPGPAIYDILRIIGGGPPQGIGYFILN